MSATQMLKDLHADAEVALRHLIGANEPHQMLEFNSGAASEVPGFDGDRAHDAMTSAVELQWVVGEVSEYHSGMALWTHVRVTVTGMRHAGAWPPAGREHIAGSWNSDHWGAWARPCLERLRDEPDWGSIPASFGMGEVTDAHRRWLALLLLAEAGYIDARFDPTSATGARLTLEGLRAASEVPDPFAGIRRLVREGDVTRGLIDLVEDIVADFVQRTSADKDVDMLDRNGNELHKLWQRLDRLGSTETLDGLDVAVLRVALEARNHVGHTTTDLIVPDVATVAWIVDGVEGVLSRNE